MYLRGIVVFFFTISGRCFGRAESNPSCNPHTSLRAAPTCEGLGSYTSVTVNGLYNNYNLFYNVLGSRYYFARIVGALGIVSDCPTNNATLYALNLVTAWSGLNGGSVGVAIDGTQAFNSLILRKCAFPTDQYPFLCTGANGTSGTQGESLGTISYIPILQDNNNRWTLFGNCWNAKRPSSPDATSNAVSFNVFSLDSSLNETDYALVVKRLHELGFSTDSDNLIRPFHPTF